MANWKKIVEDHSKRAYKWPEGWDSRETIAEQLECSPDRVSDILSKSIKDGEIEKKAITYWDNELKRKITSFGYRQLETETKPKKVSVTIKWPPAEGTRLARTDNSKSKGTYIGKGKVQWDSGSITQPKERTVKKIIIA